jgi:hypothetical protein
VSLVGSGGKVTGRTVSWEMTVVNRVVLVATMFGSAKVHRLPAAGERRTRTAMTGGKRREGICIILSVQMQVVTAARADVWGWVPTTKGP